MKWSDYLREDEEQPIKRKRGRPRKNPIPAVPNDLEKSKSKINIDGFLVSNEGTFNPTPEYLSYRYEAFNKRYFDNELPRLYTADFKIKKIKTALGAMHCKYYGDIYGNVDNYEDLNIYISVYFNRDEKTYCATLLHEMIHVYELSVLMQIPSHEDDFINKMNYINEFGPWHVSTTETTEEEKSRGGLNSSIKNGILKKYLGLVFNKSSNKYIAFLFAKNKKDNLFRLFDKKIYDTRYFEILDSDFFANYKSCHLNRSFVSGWTKSKEDIDKMIAENRIRELFEEKINHNGMKFEEAENEAIKDAIEESDPYITVNKAKVLDDDSIFVDMSII